MNISRLTILGAALAALVCFGALAQQPKRPRSVEDRLSVLEHQVARLETQLGIRTTPGAPSSAELAVRNQATAQRLDRLERRLDSLSAEVKRAEQQADAAMRTATQAQRDATLAQQMARDAANRIR